MLELSEKIKEHFRNPENLGEIESAEGMGQSRRKDADLFSLRYFPPVLVHPEKYLGDLVQAIKDANPFALEFRDCLAFPRRVMGSQDNRLAEFLLEPIVTPHDLFFQLQPKFPPNGCFITNKTCPAYPMENEGIDFA